MATLRVLLFAKTQVLAMMVQPYVTNRNGEGIRVFSIFFTIFISYYKVNLLYLKSIKILAEYPNTFSFCIGISLCIVCRQPQYCNLHLLS